MGLSGQVCAHANSAAFFVLHAAHRRGILAPRFALPDARHVAARH